MASQLSGGPERPVTPVRVLRRSRTDRFIGGVCGGLGRYLGVDPLLMRIAAIALALSRGAGALAYNARRGLMS
jgi:phage shock protein C